MKGKKIELVERAKSAEIPCVNTKCKYWNDLFSQNCSAEANNGEPFIEYCSNYIPKEDKILEMEKENNKGG